MLFDIAPLNAANDLTNGIWVDAHASGNVRDLLSSSEPRSGLTYQFWRKTFDAGVSPLLSGGGPATIPRFVVPGAIDTVDRVRERRSLAHVFEEILEGEPALANGDVLVAGLLVPAPLRHGEPGRVGDGSGASVPEILGSRCLSSEATATLVAATTAQVASRDTNDGSAIALAFPEPGTRDLGLDPSDGNESCKSHSCQVSNSRHSMSNVNWIVTLARGQS